MNWEEHFHASGNWTAKSEDETRIAAAEMKIGSTGNYTWMDNKRKEGILTV